MKIRVLFHKNSTGPEAMWVAQGLDVDIAAQGRTLEEAQQAFECTFETEVTYARQMNRDLDSIGRAPDRYWDVWRRAWSATPREEHKLEPPGSPYVLEPRVA